MVVSGSAARANPPRVDKLCQEGAQYYPFLCWTNPLRSFAKPVPHR
jgi:hypothetical protein